MAGTNNNGMPDWLANAFGIGGGLGTAGMGLYGLNGGGGKNPADAANNRIGQIPGQTKPYYQPYMDAGKGALSDLQNQYKDLLGGDKYNELGKNYKESPGYKYNLEQAMNAGNNAAAAGGMAGSGQHQTMNAGTAAGLASQDFNQYMQGQMGLYGEGLHGTEHLNDMGYDANKDYAGILGNTASQQGYYDYAGQDWKNQNKGKAWSDILSGLGTAGASFFGGPAGGAGMEFIKKMFGG